MYHEQGMLSMASIVERKNLNGTTHYRMLIRRKGVPSLCLTFGTKKEAKDWANEHEHQYIKKPMRYQQQADKIRLSLRRNREFKTTED